MAGGVGGEAADVEEAVEGGEAAVGAGGDLRGLAKRAKDFAGRVEDGDQTIGAQGGNSKLSFAERSDRSGRNDGKNKRRPLDFARGKLSVKRENLDGVSAAVGDDEAAGGVEDEIVAEDDGVFLGGLGGKLAGALAVRSIDQDGRAGCGEDVVAARRIAGDGANAHARIANEAGTGHELAVGLRLRGHGRRQKRQRSKE